MKRSVGTFVISAVLALAILTFTVGIGLGAASSVRGTTIMRDHPIDWASLPAELLRPSWRQVFERDPWLLVLFASVVGAAVLSRLSPDMAAKPAVRRVVAVILILGFLPAVAGGLDFMFTLLDANLWDGLDGEWLDEDHPAFEAFFFAYATLCWASWAVFRQPRSRHKLAAQARLQSAHRYPTQFANK